jgi:hypothetical protein
MALLYNNIDNFADNRSKYKVTIFFFKNLKSLQTQCLLKETVRFLTANILELIGTWRYLRTREVGQDCISSAAALKIGTLHC